MSSQFLRTAVILTAATATALLVGACGARTSKSGDAPAWDPCIALPDSAVHDLGLNYKAHTEFHGQSCAWANLGSGYNLDVHYRTNSQFSDWTEPEDPSEVTIGSYSGHTYHVKGNSHPFMCALQLETKNANVVFTVTNTNYRDEDPCSFATRAATGLEKYLPPAR